MCVSLCVTKGKSLESVPTWPNQGWERSFVQGCKCGFTCLGLRRLLTFSGSVLERGAQRAGAWWCAGARCLSGCGRWWCQEGPVGQGRVDRGGVRVSNSSTLRSATACFSQARGGLRGHWWLLPQEMWKVSKALPGSREGSWPFHQEHAGELRCSLGLSPVTLAQADLEEICCMWCRPLRSVFLCWGLPWDAWWVCLCQMHEMGCSGALQGSEDGYVGHQCSNRPAALLCFRTDVSWAMLTWKGRNIQI